MELASAVACISAWNLEHHFGLACSSERTGRAFDEIIGHHFHIRARHNFTAHEKRNATHGRQVEAFNSQSLTADRWSSHG